MHCVDEQRVGQMMKYFNYCLTTIIAIFTFLLPASRYTLKR